MNDFTTPSTQAPTPVSLNWKIAGKAGEGVMTTSDTLAKVCHRHGLFVFNYYEYPSLIKGGHQTGQTYASSEHATCQKRNLDVLVAFNENAFKIHQAEITKDTVVICEFQDDGYDITPYQSLTSHILNISMKKISRELTGKSIATNTAALGASAYFLGLDPQLFHQVMSEQFASKGQEVIDGNIKVFDTAYQAAAQLGQPKFQVGKFPSKGLLLNGGHAIGSGAIASGLQFYSAYPMSPSSNTLHYVAAQQDKYPLIVRHVEDEIAAMNLAVGASFAGVRAMTGSAGGGFALMAETLSLVGVTELPLVVLIAQRPGPATGLPTWTGQGDLQFALNAGHGEFQRVIMTPGNTQEHFELTRKAFELAEKYQIPVLILSDKFIIETLQTMPAVETQYQLQHLSMVSNEELPQDDSYRRYSLQTEKGVSKRSIPGQPHGMQITNSYEHDEFGYATEDGEMTIQQVEKRAKKMAQLIKEIPQPMRLGPDQAEITLVCWGSTVSVLNEVLYQQSVIPQYATMYKSVNVVHIPCMWPFPSEKFLQLINGSNQLVMVEGNYTGQGEKLIRQETGVQFEQHLRRFDGRPFYAEDILEWLKK